MTAAKTVLGSSEKAERISSREFRRGLGEGADGRRKETICCKDCRCQNMESEEEQEGVDSDTEII